ncbi:MAG: sugar ABC transporter substrate-binding protein [Spirochaetota bacterium]
MNRSMRGAITLILLLVSSIAFAGGAEEETSEYRLAWYASAVHPYFDSVQRGVEAFEADTGIEVHKQIGPDWTQDSQTQNLETLAARGFTGFSVYPSDPGGANSVYRELADRGINIINFGTSTTRPTPASFAVATDVKYAAQVATEELIKAMGGSGQILNVLEVITDANTILRKEGIEEVVAQYPDVEIVQEISDMTSIEEATEKIENAIAAQRDVIDGIICTGYTTTVAATQILNEINAESREIAFVGIDDDPVVLDAIRNGTIDMTIAQNPFGHGYIPLMILKHMEDGYEPRDDVYFVNAGLAVVTADNVDSFSEDLQQVTQEILATLTTDYLVK